MDFYPNDYNGKKQSPQIKIDDVCVCHQSAQNVTKNIVFFLFVGSVIHFSDKNKSHRFMIEMALCPFLSQALEAEKNQLSWNFLSFLRNTLH